MAADRHGSDGLRDGIQCLHGCLGTEPYFGIKVHDTEPVTAVLYSSQAVSSAGLPSLMRYVVCLYVPKVVHMKLGWDVGCRPTHHCETVCHKRTHCLGDEMRLLQMTTERNMFIVHGTPEDRPSRVERRKLLRSWLSVSEAAALC